MHGQDTTEEFVSSKYTVNRSHRIPFNLLKQHALNTSTTLECIKCGKFRVVYCQKKANSRLCEQMKLAFSELLLTWIVKNILHFTFEHYLHHACPNPILQRRPFSIATVARIAVWQKIITIIRFAPLVRKFTIKTSCSEKKTKSCLLLEKTDKFFQKMYIFHPNVWNFTFC